MSEVTAGITEGITLYEWLRFARDTEGAPPSGWELMERIPTAYEPLVDLLSWSMNYERGSIADPWNWFLDLVGFSQEHYGERISPAFYRPSDFDGLGYVELWKLAEALTAWANDPEGCESVTLVLVGAEF